MEPTRIYPIIYFFELCIYRNYVFGIFAVFLWWVNLLTRHCPELKYVCVAISKEHYQESEEIRERWNVINI